ncbi:DNA phosphorothioation-associated DGQHR protein 1 [Polaromonas sp. CT11-55]|uniref:DNA phosphorothioation-associated DGQHR protein 1 n=1 Tax=Polaromonas sp. CT11-55 TaxID=3243045 RepID=UPI0039A73E45
MISFPYQVPAIRVEQPIGIFYVTVLPARLLLDVAYSDALSAHLRDSGTSYELTGTQRLPQPKRIQPIADYINRADSSFPNSIILAANFRKEDGLIEDEEWADDETPTGTTTHQRWSITDTQDSGSCLLTIPSREKLAAIIDGQHRLFAFTQADSQRLDMNLICSIFLDLPKPFQAQLFATINSTQKPVDKSLTYELFGYNLEEEQEAYWSPDKLAVFLTRKLGTEDGSPLKGRIVIAPKKDAALEKLSETRSWKVSTAVVVEGIMRLFTSNPKKDSSYLLAVERKRRSDISTFRKDKSPLREPYLNSADAVIYQMTLNYLKVCDKIFWEPAKAGSFITKTVGVQALFDILRLHSAKAYSSRNISESHFQDLLLPAGNIDFSSAVFKNASGSGRTAIRRAIEEAIG